MGWTEVPDRAAGDVFTSGMWNTYIRDNFNSGCGVILADEVLSVAAASIELADINQDFRHLEVLASLGGSSNLGTISGGFITFNGDTGANYDNQSLDANGTSAGAVFNSAQSSMNLSLLTVNGATTLFNGFRGFVPNYTATDRDKIIVSECGAKVLAVLNGMFIRNSIGAWRSSAAITSIAFAPQSSATWRAGSRLTLIGYP